MRNYQYVSKNNQCPVCSTHNAHLLWSASSKQAAQHFVLEEKDPGRHIELVSHIEKIWGQNTCEILKCENCEFCYSSPYIAGDEQFYSLAHSGQGYPIWKWEFQITFELLSKHGISHTHLLEIGAGDGAFVKKVATDILPKENILCTEYSEFGRSQIEIFGVKCISEDVRNLLNVELEHKFDIICMFQVLEHMDSLNVLFQKLNWLMKKNGSLFIAVPNSKRIEFNELNGALLDMPPNHIGRWNDKCFEEIGKKNGFLIEDYKVEKSNFKSMIKQSVTYRLLQNSQKKGSFENLIPRIKNRYLHKIMHMIGFTINLMKAIPAITRMNSLLGGSQWVHFIKT